MSIDARQFHSEILVWDAHRDVAYEAPLKDRFLQKWMVGVDLDLDLVRAGGVNVQVYAISTASTLGLAPTAQALKELEIVLSMIESHADKVVLVTKIDEILAAKKARKVAAILNFEGAEPILTELGLLRMFYRLGLRAMGLTWNFRNEVADGGYEGREGGGLSQFGRSVVKEMNHLGMVVDIAHMTERGMLEVLELSETPAIVSHGAVGAVRPGHHRAYGDHILEKIAQKGGVFCVTTIPEALASDPQEATLSRFIDHVDHAVKVMGVDHVGLGADFDVYLSRLGLPAERWLRGLEEVDKWPSVTAALIDRNYPLGAVRKIMGENLLNLYQQVIG
ncbi:MAG: dipeptidase [Chloroflexi bacterium]|nr:dipeptidase [Chloroflexota bacterium]